LLVAKGIPANPPLFPLIFNVLIREERKKKSDATKGAQKNKGKKERIFSKTKLHFLYPTRKAFIS
jgi:hypothetical protein